MIDSERAEEREKEREIQRKRFIQGETEKEIYIGRNREREREREGEISSQGMEMTLHRNLRKRANGFALQSKPPFVSRNKKKMTTTTTTTTTMKMSQAVSSGKAETDFLIMADCRLSTEKK